MRPIYLGIVYSILHGIAWLAIGSSAAAILGWFSTIFLVAFISDKKVTILQALFIGGLTHVIGFCWLYDTVAELSKSGTSVTTLFFLLYLVVNSLQYGLFLIIYRNLPKFLDNLSIKSAIAWAIIESLHLRMFPWLLGHTQFAFKPFIQIAELFGVVTISFFMLWICDLLYQGIVKHKGKDKAAYAGLLFTAICIFGVIRIHQFDTLKTKTIKIAAVQSGEQNQSGDPKMFGTHKPLTDSITAPVDLVVWSFIRTIYDINESVFNINNEGALPRLAPARNLMFGTMTYRRPDKKFKSIMLIEKNGNIPLPYHKRHFIPFGEYIPYKETFPWLRYLNPHSGDYAQGKESKVFTITTENNTQARIGTVICYEAVLPKYLRETTKSGAQVLVVVSNDYWGGPLLDIPKNQHNVIAQFAAVENRRALVRTTKQGITSIVGPTGYIIAEKRDHGAGVVIADLPLIG